MASNSAQYPLFFGTTDGMNTGTSISVIVLFVMGQITSSCLSSWPIIDIACLRTVNQELFFLGALLWGVLSLMWKHVQQKTKRTQKVLVFRFLRRFHAHGHTRRSRNIPPVGRWEFLGAELYVEAARLHEFPHEVVGHAAM